MLGIEGLLNKTMDRFSQALVSVREQRYFEQFAARDTDIFIITFLRSGTTWTQMIVYQLLTGGEMDFDHIYDVSPWLSNEAVVGNSADRVNALQSPRIFKSHDPYNKFEPNNKFRFIHVIRDGRDVALSLLHHRKNFNGVDEDLESVYKNFIFPESEYNWCRHTKEWLDNKCKFNVLHIYYEDLLSDFDNTVLKIAIFLDVELTRDVLSRVKERSSFEFMKKYERKFGEREHIRPDQTQFIRKGEAGHGKTIIAESQNELFMKYMQDELGGSVGRYIM